MYLFSLPVVSHHIASARRTIRFGVAMGVVFAVMTGCRHQAETVQPPVPVRLVTAQSSAASTVVSFSGTLVPRVESQLAFRVPGRIIERLVDVGTTVAGGDVLARVDGTPFRLAVQEAEAGLAQARTTLARIRRDVDRNRGLARSGAIAGADFDALKTEYANARAQVRAAQSRLERARNDLAYTTLTAPVAGTITDVQAEAGQVVVAGTPVLRLARGGEQEVQVDVPESRIGGVSRAQAARIRLLSLPDADLVGHVREVASVADTATRTYRVRVALPDLPEAARLGMTASVRFEVPADAQLQLPITALHHEGEQPAVWVLPEGARRLVLRPVRLSAMSTDRITIASGVAPGERVVAAGVHRLDAGMDVQAWDGRLP